MAQSGFRPPRGACKQDVAAGDRAEISGISMSQPTRLQTRRPPPQRHEARGAAPALAGASRPAFVRQAVPRARLDRVGLPLASRTRRIRDRIGRRLAGSGLVHGLVLALLSLLFAQHDGRPPQEQTPVDMVYDHPGQAGTVGPSSPDTAGTPPAAKPVPQLQPPAPVPPAEPPPVPEIPKLPELQVPEPLPVPVPVPPPPPQQVPIRRQAQPSTSPFSHPMDLSFSQAPSLPRARHGRPAGSTAPMDLSLGPLVRDGRLLTPYASTSSIKGVSDDYGDEIGAWIRRHMFYPEEAARRGEDGPSHVQVVLDRQGQVKSIRLVNSSGSHALDDATEGMFRNARLPPVPPDMTGNSFDVDLTIDYILIRH
jgi:protein TonB